MSQTFPHFTLRGGHREGGPPARRGAAPPGSGQHLDLIYAQGAQQSQLAPETARSWARAFGPFIGAAAPHFLEEIEGLAQGADIETDEALLLQVRQEAAHVARFGTVDLECTSFAVSGPYTRTGGTFAGQNADLSGGIEQFARGAHLR